jgi:hypothetical protein
MYNKLHAHTYEIFDVFHASAFEEAIKTHDDEEQILEHQLKVRFHLVD